MSETLHQVFLMVSDVDRSTEFYEESLGLSVESQSGDKVTFQTGRCSLVIEEDFDEETLAAFGLEPPGDNRGEGAIVVVEVDDVDTVHERAQAAGAEVLAPPRDVDWGRRMMLVRDPDGYVLEISRPIES